MRYYVLTLNGVLVGVTHADPYSFNLPGVSIHEFDGTIPDLNTHTWDDTVEDLVGSSLKLSRLAFISRFTVQERLGIRASADPVVKDIINMLEVAEFIDVTRTDTIQSVYYLATVGLIASARIPEILSTSA